MNGELINPIVAQQTVILGLWCFGILTIGGLIAAVIIHLTGRRDSSQQTQRPSPGLLPPRSRKTPAAPPIVGCNGQGVL